MKIINRNQPPHNRLETINEAALDNSAKAMIPKISRKTIDPFQSRTGEIINKYQPNLYGETIEAAVGGPYDKVKSKTIFLNKKQHSIFRSGLLATLEHGFTLKKSTGSICADKKYGSAHTQPYEIPGLDKDEKGRMTLRALDVIVKQEDPDEVAAKKAFKVLAEILVKARKE